jgi:putative ABC transport system permease protein
MNNRDIIELCLGNLLRRRTRTILAVIGVVVGTCAIVVMLSIGFGLSASYQQQIESYGNLHTVQVYNYGGGMDMNGQPIALDDATIAKIEALGGVSAVTPVVEQYLTLGIGRMVCGASVFGIRPDTMEKFGFEVAEGRLLEPGDKYAVVFGKNVATWFYNPRQQQGSGYNGEATVDVITNDLVLTGDWSYGTPQEGEGEIRYELYKAQGVGLLAAENDESSYRVYMNIDVLKEIKNEIRKANGEVIVGGKTTYDQALVYVDDINDVSGICDIIRDDMGFETYSLNDWLESMKETAAMIQGILGGIGAISLLVAALGIANTMIMSIYERTKEIGVMKVIGANLRDIRKMFMLEAGMIGFIGGVAGVVASYIISLLLNTVLLPFMQGFLGFLGGDGSVVSVIPVWVAAGSLVFATLIGLASGYYPAKRAMNLSALEGLKNE